MCLPMCVEASVGQSWTMEGLDMVPKVSSLVETFLAAIGTWCPHMFSDSAGPRPKMKHPSRASEA